MSKKCHTVGVRVYLSVPVTMLVSSETEEDALSQAKRIVADIAERGTFKHLAACYPRIDVGDGFRFEDAKLEGVVRNGLGGSS